MAGLTANPKYKSKSDSALSTARESWKVLLIEGEKTWNLIVTAGYGLGRNVRFEKRAKEFV